MLNEYSKHRSGLPSDSDALISKLSPVTAVLEIKDPYTGEHGRRVAIYAARLAQRIGLNAIDIENIRLGGLLHDMGKIGLSATVLKNTRKQLSVDMMAEVRLHPIIGVALLKDVDIPAAVIDCVQYHHEKIDGSGYPFALKSDQIPLGAKIVRVVDCFDAITTDRPYQQRKSW
ncbi:MAG: HD domain-containing protein, partial [Desulfobacterales bacterium]|nr:HD domain-containing protein [Desulfobacterales bacterium]